MHLNSLSRGLSRDLFKPFSFLIEVCSVDILVACWKICAGFKRGFGIPSGRRIYESNLVGQTKLLS